MHAGLGFQHPAVARLVAVGRVDGDRCLASYVRLEELLATLGGELAGLAPDQEIGAAQDAVVKRLRTTLSTITDPNSSMRSKLRG